MATPAARPLTSWLTHLRDLPLPVDPRVRAAVLEALAQGELNSSALVQLLMRDPAQCWLIFAEANRALASHDRDAYTLEHAVTLLGSSRIKRLLTSAAALDSDHPHAIAYRRHQLQSAHAAWQARMWAEGSGRWHPDDTFWATLFTGVPLWMAALAAGDRLAALDLERAHHGRIAPEREREVLGCGLLELGAALARTLPLPASAREAWRLDLIAVRRPWLELARAARWDDPPVLAAAHLGELHHHTALAVVAATLFAREADWDWYSHRSERLLRVVAGACRKPLATIVASSHQLAAHFSRSLAATVAQGPGGPLPMPGYRLCCRWQERNALTPSAADRPTIPTPRWASLADLEAWLTSEPRTLPSAAPRLCELLTAQLGAPRVLVLAVARRDGQAVWRALARRGFDPALDDLGFAARPGTLFDQLAHKAAMLKVDAALRPRITPHLPPALAAATAGAPLLLTSLAFAGQPRGALLLDWGGEPLPDAASERLRTIAQLLGRTLVAEPLS